MILAYFVTAVLSNKSAETREWDPLACAPLNRPAPAAIAGYGGMRLLESPSVLYAR